MTMAVEAEQPDAKVVYMTQEEAIKQQTAAIGKLGRDKAWPFTTGNPLVAFNSGLVGLVSNSFFRRMLMVRPGLILSSLPMAGLPGITVTLLYPTLISTPILTRQLNCPLCASLRGAALGFTLGAVYPFLLALPLNSAMAVKYNTMEIPLLSKKNFKMSDVFDFWLGKMRYFKGQFISIAIFQTLVFAVVADRQFQLVHSGALGVKHSSDDDEDSR